MSLLDVLAIAILVSVPANVVGVFLIVRFNRRHPELATLRFAAISALCWLIELGIACFFSVAHLLHVPIWPDVTTVLLVIALILPTFPNAYWASLYFRDGFH